MKTTGGGARMSRYRAMSDGEVEAEIQRLQGEIDALDNGYWPSASAKREEHLDALTAMLAEQARRRI